MGNPGQNGSESGLYGPGFSKRAIIGLSILLGLAWLIQWIFLVGMGNRGFDITDEGYSLSMILNQGEVKSTSTAAHIYLSRLYNSIGDYGTLRQVCIVLLGVSGLLPGFALAYLTAQRGTQSSLIAPATVFLPVLTAIGAMLYYYRFHPVPTYNWACSLCLNIWIASVILFCTRKSGWAIYLAGAFAAFALIAKPSSGGIAGLLTGILVMVLLGFSRKMWLSLVWLALGSASAVLIHLYVIPGGMESVLTMQNSIAMRDAMGNETSTFYLFQKAGIDLIELLGLSLRISWIALPMVAALLFRSRVGGILCSVVFLGAVCFAWPAMKEGFAGSGGYKSVMALNFMFLLFIGGTAAFRLPDPWKEIVRNRRAWCLLVLLLAFPVIGAFGTGNKIYANMLLHQCGWFAVFGAALLFSRFNAIGAAVTACVVGLIGVLVPVKGAVEAPQRLASGILDQGDTRVTIGNDDGQLYLDRDSAQALGNLKAGMDKAGIPVKAPVLAFCDIPGLVIGTGRLLPGGFWFYSHDEGFDMKALNTYQMEQLQFSSPPPILMENGPFTASVVPDLRKYGIDFPASYRRQTRLVWPAKNRKYKREIDLWVPGAGEKIVTGKVTLPIEMPRVREFRKDQNVIFPIEVDGEPVGLPIQLGGERTKGYYLYSGSKLWIHRVITLDELPQDYRIFESEKEFKTVIQEYTVLPDWVGSDQ